METLAAIFMITYTAIVLSLIFFGFVFPAWMLIHTGIITVKSWPKDAVRNILLALLIFIVPVVGALIYYFAVYRGSKLLSIDTHTRE